MYPHGFHCRDNKVKCAYGHFNSPYTHKMVLLCALHNQYKHLENIATMIYTKYVVLLTQLCMDAQPILSQELGYCEYPGSAALLVTSYLYFIGCIPIRQYLNSQEKKHRQVILSMLLFISVALGISS